MKKWKKIFYKRPILATYLISILMGSVLFLFNIKNFFVNSQKIFLPLVVLLYAIFMIQPIVLTICNLLFLLGKNTSKEVRRVSARIEILTFILGVLYTFLYLAIDLVEIKWVDWQTQLCNRQLHTPIATNMIITFLVLWVISIASYILFKSVSIRKLPPLITVVGISALYLGVGICSLFIIQIVKLKMLVLVLAVFPLNCILIFIKTIKEIVWQWEEQRETLEETGEAVAGSALAKLNQYIKKSKYLPWISFILLLPLLGIIIMILVLFGQRPDSIIRMWTETADWNLSQRIAPQNVMMDEHYLCTVAAGGHKKIVKPIRLGERHGHQVIVNRQLCIANAFEQILEEKMPCFHKTVRYLYDNLGYPIARHIKSPYTADVIYYLMKPAEWMFLIVIYFCDVKPENRIFIQYLPKL